MSEVTATIERFRNLLSLQEAREMSLMAAHWLEVERNIQAHIDRLVNEVNFRLQQGEPVNITRVMQLEQYQDMIRQLRMEVIRYNQWATGIISDAQAQAARFGIANSNEIITANYTDRNMVAASFRRLPFEAVEYMVGNASDGSPLNRLLMESYPTTVTRLTQTLINSTALGVNPRETAKRMVDDMSGNFQSALTTARTEQNRVFREASTQAAKESGVVDGWIWRAALSGNTCEACLASDGTRHDTNEALDDHPNGRCFKQWIVKDLPPLQVQSGETWFRNQGADEQRRILGPGKYEAWRDGLVSFDQFAQVKQSSRWGNSIQTAPLQSLLN